VGVPGSDFFDDAEPQVEAAVHAAIALLSSMGARLVEVDLPHAHLAGSAGWIVAMAEAVTYHEQRLKEHPELLDPLVRERLETALFYSARDYIKALRVRSILQEEMARALELRDVIAVPGSTSVAGPLGSDVKPGSTSPGFRGGNTFLGNMTGNPAISIPCGFSEGPPALPISLQLYGRPFDETTLFRAAHAYESATDWHRRRPPLRTA
jgi:aspartyl-tRNA(Asn)/glutamyl-tRNA(Gln) amidotransferase subunit A